MVILQDVGAWALIAVAVAFVAGAIIVSKRQAARREAERRLNVDLYDRRFAIYMAFHELLLAVATKTDVSNELHRAATARVQCRFLLNDAVGVLLDELMTQVLLLMPESNPCEEESGPNVTLARRHKEDRICILDRIDDLASAFEPVMKLQRS